MVVYEVTQTATYDGQLRKSGSRVEAGELRAGVLDSALRAGRLRELSKDEAVAWRKQKADAAAAKKAAEEKSAEKESAAEKKTGGDRPPGETAPKEAAEEKRPEKSTGTKPRTR